VDEVSDLNIEGVNLVTFFVGCGSSVSLGRGEIGLHVMFCGAKLIITLALKAEILFAWCFMLLNSLLILRVALVLDLLSQRRRTMGHAA
jgi:hypothetical protein